MSSRPTIAFDADDTLWHNENAFADAEHRFNEIVAPWADVETAQQVLLDFERSHVGIYGYGVKSFALSMIAAACEISNNEIGAATLRTIVGVEQHCFDVEVVADKDVATYRRILARHRVEPANLIMVGNSIVSDVAPLLEIGARAVHIPYEVTWALETATIDPEPSDQWFRLDSISQLPELIESLT